MSVEYTTTVQEDNNGQARVHIKVYHESTLSEPSKWWGEFYVMVPSAETNAEMKEAALAQLKAAGAILAAG